MEFAWSVWWWCLTSSHHDELGVRSSLILFSSSLFCCLFSLLLVKSVEDVWLREYNVSEYDTISGGDNIIW